MIGEKKVSWTVKLIVIVACIAVLFAMNMLTDGKFLQPSNLKTIAVNASVPTFTAWAFVFIFASGFIDLSLGAVIVLAATEETEGIGSSGKSASAEGDGCSVVA